MDKIKSQSKKDLNRDSINDLLVEYQQCNDGYNSRDHLGVEDFSKITQIFFLFFALLLASNVVTGRNNELRLFFSVTIAFLGSVSLFALLLDLEGTYSSKAALRLRANEIEEELRSHRNTPVMWRMIEDREPRFMEEKLVKKAEGMREKEIEGNIFVLGGRLFIIFWFMLVSICNS